MKFLKSNKSIKYAILCFVFLFISISLFSKNYAQFNDSFFPNDQTVTGPGFFPFNNSQGVVDIFNQQCPNPTFGFDGPNSLFGSGLEVGPAANSSETGSRSIITFDMDGNAMITFTNGFPIIDPFTMVAFDPSMGDILGLSFVPGAGFPGSTEFMIVTTFNCDGGTSSTSTSSTSSSGQSVNTSSSGTVLTGPQVIGRAINFEKNAKSGIDIKDLLMSGAGFSVSMALDDLMSSLSDLQDLQNRFQGENDVMLGMSTVGTELMDAINADNEAIMLLDPLKDADPSITNSELTQAITKARKLINSALRIKKLIEGKLKKLENKDKDK